MLRRFQNTRTQYLRHTDYNFAQIQMILFTSNSSTDLKIEYEKLLIP